MHVITGIERITIDVPNLNQAVSEYECLHRKKSVSAETSKLFLFQNLVVELRENISIENSRIRSLTFLDDSGTQKPQAIIPPPRGIEMYRVGTQFFSSEDSFNDSTVAVDHIVLISNDLDSCKQQFGVNGIGIRLALDKTVPVWGGRMLFFRAGQCTLEVIQNSEKSQNTDSLWGIAYLCSNIEEMLSRLENDSVHHSNIREGRKKGTMVCTIKSHNLGLPTLLLEKL